MNQIVYNPIDKKFKVFIDLQDEQNLDCGSYHTLEEAKKQFEWERTNGLGVCQHDAKIIYLKHPADRMRELEERVAKLERQMKRCQKK